MAILDSLGFSDFIEAFRQSGGVHQVWNLLSLDGHLHKKFDLLEMWFEGTEKVRCSETCQSYQLVLCAATLLQNLRVVSVRRGIYLPQLYASSTLH